MNNDEMVVKTVWKSAHAVRDWPGMVTIRRFSPFLLCGRRLFDPSSFQDRSCNRLSLIPGRGGFSLLLPPIVDPRRDEL